MDPDPTASKHHGPKHCLPSAGSHHEGALCGLLPLPLPSLHPGHTTAVPLEFRKQEFPGLTSSLQASLSLLLLAGELGTWRMMATCSRNKQTLHYSISYFPFPAKPDNILALFRLMYGCILLRVYFISSCDMYRGVQILCMAFLNTEWDEFERITLLVLLRPPLIPLYRAHFL